MEKEEKLFTARLIVDFFHRISMHHAMWFAEVSHQLGKEKAYEILENVWKSSWDNQVSRIAKLLGFGMEDSIPEPLLSLTEEKLIDLRNTLAINWLAGDGIWFQSVEFSLGMFDAKRCNDSCWAQFSPFEAWSIKKLLNQSESPGLPGLKQALGYRLYACINKHSFRDEDVNSFVYQMDDCRVQSARKRKGLEDYSCKSAGIVEYREFASAIDRRIKTECICCPPDKHPDDYYCAWKFSIENTKQ